MSMARILCLETATSVCSVALAVDGQPAVVRESTEPRSHAERINTLIAEVLTEAGSVSLTDLDAIAVSAGPGSYTGLRIGLSTAKGLCFGTGLPLLLLDTLQGLSAGAKKIVASEPGISAESVRFAPMLDARRMEVFVGFYNIHLKCIFAPAPTIIDAHSLRLFDSQHTYFVFGTGADKCKPILQTENIRWIDALPCSAAHLTQLAETAFAAGRFADLAYAVPNYTKSFYSRK